jgi:3-oxoacyl-[acyl-carrier protein] reductase
MNRSAGSTRALITGGGRGIGAAIAVALAEVGHPVILNYRSDDASAAAVKARIEAAGGSAELCKFDVADGGASAAALEKLLQDERPIGVLVNNAGIARDNAFPAMSQGDWSAVTRTSLDGFFNVTQPLVMPMVRQRWGRIISIASISGTMGNRGQTNYAAAKAGLIGATKSLSFELAKRNITVNAVAPGLIDTDMLASVPVDEIKKVIPMRRLGRPEEVAALVRFLASDDAAYITGQVITISGGLG